MFARLSTAQRVAAVKNYYQTNNSAEVGRRLARDFNRPAPTRGTILDIVKKFEATGNVLQAAGAGRPRSVNTKETRARLVRSLDRSPQKSSRRLSAELGVSQFAVISMMRELKLKPFRPRLIHALNDDDYDRRVEFAENFLEMVRNDETLLDRVIWSDEAIFKLNGHINRHNCVYWASENPNVTIEREQFAPGVQVWCAIWSGGIIGPFFFDGSVNGQSYLAMLEEQFWPEVEPLVEAHQLYFQQDGASAHYAKQVRDWLDEKFPARWIGRRGPIEWPPRSPDLTPPDFFLWGVLKDIVYSTKPRTVEDLQKTIRVSVRSISVETCEKVCRSLPGRLSKCLELHGGQLELF